MIAAEDTCAVDGCDQPSDGAGLCETHWRRWAARKCLICERHPIHGHGLCMKHWTRWRDHGTLEPRPRPTRGRCGADTCTSSHYAHGLCFTHYQRQRRAAARAAQRKAQLRQHQTEES